MHTQLLTLGASVSLAESILRAKDLLLSGQLVAFPTDTVYGLAAAAFNPTAIKQLYRVKGRQSTKAIAVLIGNPGALEQVTDNINSIARQLAEHFWPGPLTLVVARHPSLPALLSPQPTIGVRMPNHPVALALLNLTGPLAVTSANRSGQPDATTAQEVDKQLGGRIPLILDGGPTPGGRPSTVVDSTLPELTILREGPISLAELRSSLAGMSPD